MTTTDTEAPTASGAGQLSPEESERTTLAALGVVGAAVLVGLFVGLPGLPQAPPPPAPRVVYATSDGLPAALVQGRTYTATYRATFPRGWKVAHNFLSVTVDRAGAQYSSIVCSQGYVRDLAGQTVTYRCPIGTPDLGAETFHLFAGSPYSLSASSQPVATADFRHTVVKP